ncbi:MAG: SIR2 family protein, partial [Bifidobacteriaceae bacterium]|nr:SIR2 family protein [Bifidobacteriaceae bacterium]
MTPVRNNRPSTRLRRSPTPFFLQPQTVDALAALSSPGIERLVIYCGAGTTIDRTGLGWKELIDQAFPPVEEQDSDLPTANDIRFLHRHFQPPEVASILSQYVAERHGGYYKPGYRDEIAKNLVPALYFEKRVAPGQAWGRFMAGRLGGNISRLAILAASLGKSVIVATTNFDDLLEKNITERISLDYLARLRDDPQARPVKTKRLDTNQRIGLAKLAPGTIALVYLHGRVPREGSPSSRVVLTERDYADTRKRTVGRLSEILSMPRTGFLTVGASLT